MAIAPQSDFYPNLPMPRPLKGKSEQQSVRSEILLGSPGAGCAGLGICKMMTTKPAYIRYKCPVVNAVLSLNQEQRLRISFVKDSMDIRVQRRHFRWWLFQVLEPYDLPEELTRCLSLLADHTIRPGIYTVWETAEYLVVDF